MLWNVQTGAPTWSQEKLQLWDYSCMANFLDATLAGKQLKSSRARVCLTPRVMLKANQRLALFSSPAHSVVQRSLANNCFILSLNIYQSTYFGFNWDDINLYQQRSSKLLLGRPWLVGRYLPHIFRWLGIAPALDPAITLTAAPHVCSRRDTRSQSLDRDKSCNKCSGRGFLC